MREYLNTSHFYEKEYAEMPQFNSNEGIGFEWTWDNKKCKAVLTDKVREVRLRISSWVGMSCDAVHYYGKLYTNDLYYEQQGQKGFSNSSCQPEITQGIEITLRRPLTLNEIRENEERFKGYRVGEYINAFIDKKELIVLAQKIFKEKFVGNWKFVIDK